jgi:hypothetical protein
LIDLTYTYLPFFNFTLSNDGWGFERNLKRKSSKIFWS